MISRMGAGRLEPILDHHLGPLLGSLLGSWRGLCGSTGKHLQFRTVCSREGGLFWTRSRGRFHAAGKPGRSPGKRQPAIV